MCPRMISERFQTDLRLGLLDPILDHVRRDNNVTIEIRSHYINVYYRGGNMLRITERRKGYLFEFDLQYIKANASAKAMIGSLPRIVATPGDIEDWREALPVIKAEMDSYFSTHGKAEREFQQLVVRENNAGRIAEKTDYYICDVEYQVRETRIDMVAAKRNGRGCLRLALIEMKYADSALVGKSGVVDHVRKAHTFLSSHDLLKLKEEMAEILSVKRSLGLIAGLTNELAFSDEKPEFIFLLANHKPASGSLQLELQRLKSESFYPEFCKLADLKIAMASFFGYGLYRECVYTLDEFETIIQALSQAAGKRVK